MGREFIHLDRLNLVKEDTVFELSFSNIHPAGPTEKLDNSGIFLDIGAQEMDTIENFFDDGLTYHGKKYIYPNFNYTHYLLDTQSKSIDPEEIAQIVLGPNVHPSWQIEIVFELVRRLHHPNQLSRFQSVFGFEDEENLHKWVDFSDMEIESGKIWRVRTDSHYVKDAALLDSPEAIEPENEVDVVENLIDHANRYWAGDSTTNPIFEVLLRPEVEVIEYVKPIEF